MFTDSVMGIAVPVAVIACQLEQCAPGGKHPSHQPEERRLKHISKLFRLKIDVNKEVNRHLLSSSVRGSYFRGHQTM